ncbi:MAG: hypothetical protein K2P76_07170 [Lachnospiraceae bacterium]|nr:hypothetical protein [Lachnospiraceae bacterium]MDE6980412.1 hypothetical protein [Lachnospiraceae bacterium]
MYETDYLKLKVAEENDFYNINEQSENFVKIDGKFNEFEEKEKELRELVEEVSSNLILETDKKISDLIDGAPETLDTLKEIADAIAENETIVDTLNEAIGKKVNMDYFNTEISKLGKSVADGKALLASTISAWGNPTASDATFEVLNTNMAAEFGATRDVAYNQGYAKGVQDADGRALPGSVNYQSGYNQGVADADNRANSNSPNWQNGYAVGHQQGAATESATCLEAIKAGVSHHYYAISVFFESAKTNYVTPFISASGYNKILGTIHKRVNDYYVTIVILLWSGTITQNNMQHLFSWNV